MTMLKGNHLFSFGGAYARNFDYHSPSDNGAGVNNQISLLVDVVRYQLHFAASIHPGTVPSSNYSTYEHYAYSSGMVSSTQVMYTRGGNNLAPLAVGTPATDKSVIPVLQRLLPGHLAHEAQLHPDLRSRLEPGNAALRVGAVSKSPWWMPAVVPWSPRTSWRSACNHRFAGQAYTPQLGYEMVRNVGAGLKYPYNPYYGEFSPRVSFAWNPHYSDGLLGKVFGNGKTVVRGGYSRIWGRLNGVDLVLVPLLGPGLLQGVTCVNPLSNGACAERSAATPANAFRIGTDGLSRLSLRPRPACRNRSTPAARIRNRWTRNRSIPTSVRTTPTT